MHDISMKQFQKRSFQIDENTYQALVREKNKSMRQWPGFFRDVILPAISGQNIAITTPVVKKTRVTPPVVKFDFIALYQKYPRKVGKTAGLKRCESQIKTQEDYALLSQAIDSYIQYLKKEGTEPKFVKHFSTFMSEWRDFTESDTGNNSLTKKSAVDSWLAWSIAKEKEGRK
jgi:hypothetical protein